MTAPLQPAASPQPPRRWSGRLALAALALALLWGAWRAHDARQQQRTRAAADAAALQQPVVYELAPGDVEVARRRTLVQAVALTGTVKALNTAVVKARVAGELQGLALREGDAVHPGQVVARIDPTEPNARLEQARQQAQAAAAQVALADRQWRNHQALAQQGFISATALDAARSSLASAQATHEAALAAQAVAQKTQSDTLLRSPIRGQVSARWAQNGERLPVDGRVLELVDPTALEWEVTVPVADATRLRVGQTATVNADGLPAPVMARVVRLSPAVQSGNRGVNVYLALPANAGLRHGQFAQGTLAVGDWTGVSLPADSVRNDRPEPYVQVLVPTEPPGTARVAHVRVVVVASGVPAAPATGGDTAADATAPRLASAGLRHVATESIAENALLLSARAGFVQENTVVRLPPAAAQP